MGNSLLQVYKHIGIGNPMDYHGKEVVVCLLFHPGSVKVFVILYLKFESYMHLWNARFLRSVFQKLCQYQR